MTTLIHPFPDLPYADLPIPPQLVRNAKLLTLFLEADPTRVGAMLPDGLSLRADSRIVLNMWSHSDPNETSGFGGFGPMSVSYLAVEVGGAEGCSADGLSPFPGRYWLHHWSSFGPARDYARTVSGLDIMPGETLAGVEGDRFLAQLSNEGRRVISASAHVGREKQRTLSGHSIYYAQRIAAAGGFEVAKFAIPWVADAFDAHSAEVEFSFPNDKLSASLFGVRRPVVVGVAFRSITLAPYIAQGVISV
jgi:hypothetical protein